MTRTEALEALIQRIAEWPQAAQDELMRSVVAIEQEHVGVYKLSPEERVAVEEGLAAADRGEYATDAQMEELWNRHGL
jgi:predicted transcriptional regulator